MVALAILFATYVAPEQQSKMTSLFSTIVNMSVIESVGRGIFTCPRRMLPDNTTIMTHNLNGVLKMHCNKCHHSLQQRSFQVWKSNDDGNHTEDMVRLTTLCSDCLVGETVPSYRPSLQRWNLGQVQAFRPACTGITTNNNTSNEDDQFEEACLWFGGTETEWVQLESSPFEAYTSQARALHVLGNKRVYDLEQTNIEPTEPSNLDGHGSSSTARGNVLGKENASIFRSPLTAATLSHAHAHLHRDYSDHSSEESEEQSSMVQKAGPRLWSIDEDNLLRQAVYQYPFPLKWPQVAKLVPNRTGKQCRERWTNHLKPTLKLTEWSPIEDALVCRLFHLMGAKWANIAKCLPGRTDNGIKNRFHHVKRRCEREMGRVVRNTDLEKLVLERIKTARRPDDFMLSLVSRGQSHCGRSASVIGSSAAGQQGEGAYQFGPFVATTAAEVVCKRCQFFVPSRQTGLLVCQKTGWCSACVATSVYVCDEALRIAHFEQSDTSGVNRVSLCSERDL